MSKKAFPGSPPWKMKQKVTMPGLSTLEKAIPKMKQTNHKDDDDEDDDDDDHHHQDDQQDDDTANNINNNNNGGGTDDHRRKQLPVPRILSLDLNDDDNDDNDAANGTTTSDSMNTTTTATATTTTPDVASPTPTMVQEKREATKKYNDANRAITIPFNNNDRLEQEQNGDTTTANSTTTASRDGTQEFDALFSNMPSKQPKAFPGSPPWKIKQKVSMPGLSTLEKAAALAVVAAPPPPPPPPTTTKERSNHQDKNRKSWPLPMTLSLDDDDDDNETNDKDKDDSVSTSSTTTATTLGPTIKVMQRATIKAMQSQIIATTRRQALQHNNKNNDKRSNNNNNNKHQQRQRQRQLGQEHPHCTTDDDKNEVDSSELLLASIFSNHNKKEYPPSKMMTVGQQEQDHHDNDNNSSSTLQQSFSTRINIGDDYSSSTLQQSFSTRLNIGDGDDDNDENDDENDNKHNHRHDYNPDRHHSQGQAPAPPRDPSRDTQYYQATPKMSRHPSLTSVDNNKEEEEQKDGDTPKRSLILGSSLFFSNTPTTTTTTTTISKGQHPWGAISSGDNLNSPLGNVYFTSLWSAQEKTITTQKRRTPLQLVRYYWFHRRGGSYYIGMIQATLFSWLYYIRPIHSIGIPLLMVWYSFPTVRIAYGTVLLLLVLIVLPVQQEKSAWSVHLVGTVLSPILSYFDYDEIIENSPIHIRESIIAHHKRYIFACQPHGVVPLCSIAHSIRQAQLLVLASSSSSEPPKNGGSDNPKQNPKQEGQQQQQPAGNQSKSTRRRRRQQQQQQSQDAIDTSSHPGDHSESDVDDFNNTPNGDDDDDDSDVWEPVNYTMPLYPTAVASQVLWTPILNHVMGLFQCVSASRASLKHALQTTSVQLYVGGTLELFETTSDEEVLHLSTKKGFIKCALQWGVDVIPVYLFGNTRIYSVIQRPALLGRMSQALQFPVTYWYGYQGWGGVSWPIPRGEREKLLYVSGQPLGMPHIPNPRPAVVNLWHKRYCKEVERLFEQYKERLPHYKKKKLVIK
jgi:hypothetical protein